MKIFLFIFAISLVQAATHEEEMKFLHEQLYQSKKQEDQVSTAAAAPSRSENEDAAKDEGPSFRKRRKEILNSKNSDQKTKIIDLEKLYFPGPSKKSGADSTR